MSRLVKNHGIRLYRKTKIKLQSHDGRIHEESIDKPPEAIQAVPSIKNAVESE